MFKKEKKEKDKKRIILHGDIHRNLIYEPSVKSCPFNQRDLTLWYDTYIKGRVVCMENELNSKEC